jgi:hypothetical protein
MAIFTVDSTNPYAWQIFPGLLCFRSSMFCSFPCWGHSHPLVSLFLGILFFEVIVNEIVFLYSFSSCSLLVYRKVTNFCKLILYPATLLKLFMVSTRFLVKFFGSFLIFFYYCCAGVHCDIYRSSCNIL